MSTGSSTRPKYRRSDRDRDDKDITAGSRRPHSSSAGTGGPVSVAKTARPWEDIVEEMEMNDSPTDSEEALPAPQPRALGVGSTDTNEGRRVSLYLTICSPDLVSYQVWLCL